MKIDSKPYKRMRTVFLLLILWVILVLAGQATVLAASGTWQQEDGVWRYYDAYGNPVTEAWKRDSQGRYCYLDENGQMAVDTLVEYNDNYYYVDSEGARVTKKWIFISNQFGLWDQDVDNIWYYFGAGGKAVKDGMKTIDEKRYLFDEEGRMLSGWQRWGDEEDIYYLGTGDQGWVHTGWQFLEPWYEMEGDYEAEEWFYFRPVSGKAYRDAKKRIDGDYYLFDENGVTKDRWNLTIPVASASDATASASDATASASDAQPAWFDEDTGKAWKGWKKAYDPEDVNEGGDEYWYYLDSEGIPFNRGGKDAKPASYVKDALEGYDIENCAAKVIDGHTYLFNDKGQMVTGYMAMWNVRRAGGSNLGGTDWEYYYFYNRETEKEGRMMTGRQTVYDDTGADVGHVHLKENGQAYTTAIVDGRLYDPTGMRFDNASDERYQLTYLGKIKFKIKGSGRILTDCTVLIDKNGKLKKSGTVILQHAEGRARYTVKDYVVVDPVWLD